ncbi:carboxymuconolactone decarboxylase family protein [Streptomyces roseochromogenus]|uniref:Alkylhydroperoxidase n=1 Tax=Streptomyces roseochromogenus subsp. oscitans DS 12.976 TaxID=1352936 RepID=V6JH60_STRRC|nr:carboxymuconolactone decarboxylase family protein [Streptomyces roseochromogenus]EST18496.1 alkylhydroperoxidase [Streptomyces roseochromogenus subsp. oscitans DS 12.976]
MEPRFNLLANDLGAKIAKRIYNVALAIVDSPLPQATQNLVMLRASQINGCGFCVDYHTKDATAAGEDQTRLHLVAAWHESTVFTDAERAALALTEEGTRIADTRQPVSEQTWNRVREHYDDAQIAALVSLIAMINANNRLNVIVRNPGGAYQPGQFADMAN